MFPCKIQEFPAKYLGAPLSLSRLSRNIEQGLIESVAAHIPKWKVGLLTMAARATLTQTTLSAISVHVSICCALSPWAIDQIDRKRRGFLWTGTEFALGGKCKVAWPLVCSSKDVGGLGLPDLRILGFALRLRWEWLRRTQPDSARRFLPSRNGTSTTCSGHQFQFALVTALRRAFGPMPALRMEPFASSRPISMPLSVVAAASGPSGRL